MDPHNNSSAEDGVLSQQPSGSLCSQCSCLYQVIDTPYTDEEKARGVAARQRIQRGQLVELAHCILVPKSEYDAHMKYTILEHYLFHWRGEMLLCLGVGSLFNHSATPSLDYRVDRHNLIITFFAARDIEAGEELTIHYGRVWFKDKTCNGEGEKESCMHEHMDDAAGFLAAVEL